jgi:hypothetical protein
LTQESNFGAQLRVIGIKNSIRSARIRLDVAAIVDHTPRPSRAMVAREK